MLSPSFQSILAPLLALLLAMGNLPAWWHCGDCRSTAPSPAAGASDQPACHSTTCCSSQCHAARSSEQPPADAEPDPGTDRSHDPSTCAACRAAIAGTTSTLQLACPLPALTVSAFTGLLPTPLLTAADVAAAHPRGPPGSV